MHGLAGHAFVVASQLCLLLAACSPQPDASRGRPTRSVGSVIAPVPVDTGPPAPRDTTPDPRLALARLEREARALAKLDGCTSAGACRTAPVGWRGCGGPRTYLVYCAASTDTLALFRKLTELERAEQAYNASTGIASTCEFRMPPAVALDGRSCRERPAGP